ncbi:MAG: hypothetical protein AAB975_03060 [Patescibacteria group bacterium]
MDILEQYEKENPEISQVPASQEFQDESFLIRLVIRLSGGRIKDLKQANYALLGFAVIAILISIFILFGTGSRSQQFLPPNFYQIDQSQYEQR